MSHSMTFSPTHATYKTLTMSAHLGWNQIHRLQKSLQILSSLITFTSSCEEKKCCLILRLLSSPVQPLSTLSLFSCQIFYSILCFHPFRPLPFRTHHATSTELNHPHCLHVSNVKKFHSDMFPQWNLLQHGCTSELCNLDLFRSRVNRYIFIFFSQSTFLNNIFFMDIMSTVSLYFENVQ